MSKKLINALRFVAGVIFGIGLAYYWTTFRPDDDVYMVAGIGIVSGIMMFLVLYFTGKGGGGD